MKLVALLFLTSMAWAAPDPTADVVRFLRTTPSFIRGEFSVPAKVILHRSQAKRLGRVRVLPIQMELNPTAGGLQFGLDESSLRIKSFGALVIRVGAIPVRVKEINYDAGSGKFSVKTDNFLPFGNAAVDRIVAAKLGEL